MRGVRAERHDGLVFIRALAVDRLRCMDGSLRVSGALVLWGIAAFGCRSDDDSKDAMVDGTTMADATGSASEGSDTTADTADQVECEDVVARFDFDRVLADLEQLEAIAEDNGGNRSSGLPGFEASHAFVRAELEAAGYVVETSSVDFNFAMRVGPGTLTRTSPSSLSFTHGEDFLEFMFTPPGDVEAPLTPVALQLGPGNQSTSACQASDFDGFEPGNIALIQRGGCTFAAKIANAAQAGAAGAIVFNQGGVASPDATDVQTVALFPQSLGDFAAIPALFTSYEVGVELSSHEGTTVHMVADTIAEVRAASNLIVETATGNPHEVVMFGAHLDSVPDGPGLNDNGTGSVAVLELARLVGSCRPARKIRFAWWAAEEFGLWGSNAYVDGLSDEQLEHLLFYLNFDMIGSPNAAYFVHDGDGSRFGQEGPPGSDLLEQFFHDDFEAAGLPLLETRFDLRSDYAAFFSAGVATGGLFTGAEGVKTQEQVDLFGGVAGEPYDACYHRACDTADNVDRETYETMARSVARALQTFGVEGQGFASDRRAPSRAEVRAAIASAHTHHRGCNHTWAAE
jgi:Zn-dependent M28 family amino/carboxypeptidase